MRTTSPRRAIVWLLLLLAGGNFGWSALAGAGKPPPVRRADNSPPSERYVPTREELEAAYQRQPGPRPQPGVFKAEITPHWFADNTRFWYRNDLRGGAKEFILVDAEKGKRDFAFDHKKLAESLSKAAEQEYKPDRLPFGSIEFVDDGKAVQFQVADVVWKCDLASYECAKVKTGQKPPADEQAAKYEDEAEADAPEAREEFTAFQRPRPDDAGREARSPDRKWTAFIKDNNVFVRDADGKETQLSDKGKAGNAHGLLTWSPDSKALVSCRVEPGDNKEVYTIESSPRGGGRAVLHSRGYPLPGDKATAYEVWTCDIENKKANKPDVEPVESVYGERPRFRWNKDQRHFTFEKLDRNRQRFRVVEVDSLTGRTRNLIDEKSDTFINTYERYTWVEYLDDSDEMIRVSERDGWKHLYLYDAKKGELKNQITKGEWVVRRIDRIDERARQVWFRAGGVNPGQDPYFLHYYRINFDGTGLVALTEGDGTHTATFSPDRKYLIDTYSRVDTGPVHELRRTSDGKLVCALEKADISALEATGWKPPEVFVAKGRDGKTDIWGIVARPAKLDPNKKYPVIEDIYAGPHSSYVPKAFSAFNRYQALTDLGFVVVKMDGMGTANRSKAFHDFCWKNLADAGFPDRILWIKALAKKYPYVDTTRVGIYGTSAGGQNAVGAVLFHPEFYKVAVASCGCHDNRMDKSSWNEAWMGYPVGPHYAECSNVTHAAKLEGKLLLMVGELDTNVPPESTLRLVDALIKAKKDFDFLVIPGANHTDGGPYGQRRRNDFFVRHLHGVEPPDRNAPQRGGE
jgi:dipeptidyl aminopeptidase/acylaminoacyl peptidase